jgi:cell division septum initiation protein DivIVA
MKKFLKILAVILALILIAMIIIPFAFKGKVQRIVEAEAEKNVNADVDFNELNISLFKRFPLIYVGLDNLTITGLGAFAADTLADIERLDATVNVIDFFKGDLRIRKIHVVEPKILLRVLDDGTANWDIVKDSEEEGSPQVATENEPIVITLDKFTISDGFIIYEDASASTYASFSGLQHQLSGDLSADFTRIKTKTGVENAYVESENIPWLNNLKMDFIADIDADLKNDIYTFRKNSLKLNELVVNFDGSIGFVEEALNMMLTFNSPSGRLKNVLSLVPAIYTREFENIESDGSFRLEGFVKGLYEDGSYPAFGLELDIPEGYFKYPSLPSKIDQIKIKASIKNRGGEIDNTVVAVNDARFNLLDNYAEMSLYLEKPVSDPYIDTKINADFDLGKLRDVILLGPDETLEGVVRANVSLKGYLSDLEGGKYDDFEALGSLLLSRLTYETPALGKPLTVEQAQLNFAPAYIDLVNFTGGAGTSDFNLKGKIESYMAYLFGEEDLRGNFLLKSSRLDLNELFTEVEGEDEEGQTSSEMTIYEVPDKLDLIFNATMDTLQYTSITMTGTRAKLVIQNRKLTVENLDSKLLGGTISLTGSYDTWDPASPLVDFALKVKNISFARSHETFYLVRQYLPLADKMTGDFSLDFSFASLLNQKMLPVLSSLTGKGSLTSGGFSVDNVNTLNLLADKLDNEGLKNISAGPVNLSFAMADGIMNVKPFDVSFKGTKMNLSGWTSFDREIGYTMKTELPLSMLGDGADQMVDDLYKKAREAGVDVGKTDKINLTALIGGSLDNPKLNLDLAQVSKELIDDFKQKGEELLEQKKEEAREKAKKEAEKIIAEGDRMAEKVLSEAQSKADELMSGARELAEKTRQEAEKQARTLEEEGKEKGSLGATAAKTAADQLRKEGNKQADNIIAKARKEADGIMEEARKSAEKIRQDARERADKL